MAELDPLTARLRDLARDSEEHTPDGPSSKELRQREAQGRHRRVIALLTLVAVAFVVGAGTVYASTRTADPFPSPLGFPSPSSDPTPTARTSPSGKPETSRPTMSTAPGGGPSAGGAGPVAPAPSSADRTDLPSVEPTPAPTTTESSGGPSPDPSSTPAPSGVPTGTPGDGPTASTGPSTPSTDPSTDPSTPSTGAESSGSLPGPALPSRTSATADAS